MIFNFPNSLSHVADVFPPREQTFRAFTLCDSNQYKVVILGQDPYPTLGDANGLAFSVNKGQKIPRSLVNIYKELVSDIGCDNPKHGDLTAWAAQGVLLVNSSLSVIEGQAGVHAKQWRPFTEAWIAELGAQEKPLVWVLWGNHAQSFKHLIGDHHKIITSIHPSPLSARRGFFGSKPFSQVNQYLRDISSSEIDWIL